MTTQPLSALTMLLSRHTKRREFIALLGGAAAAWPLAARAQQRERMRRIGALMNFAATDQEGQARFAAFVEGLQELGWANGRNVQIDNGPAQTGRDFSLRHHNVGSVATSDRNDTNRVRLRH